MNLENELSKADINEYLKTKKKIFFLRVCGTGMGACAVLLKEAGYQVEGADTSFAPPMSDFLNSMEIPCHDINLVDRDFLKEYDLIVVGNSVGRNSELARTLEESGTPFTSFPTLLGETVLKNKEVLAVIGTHGKTTTSYFLTQILENLGEKPGYFIGGVIDGKTSATIGGGKFFVIEGDEYDSAYFQKYSKFHQYSINHLICTSLEFDHADIFENLEAVKQEFLQLFSGFEGEISYDPSYPATTEVLDRAHYKKALAYQAKILQSDEQTTEFELMLDGQKIIFKTNIVGEHNIANISGCMSLLHSLGFKAENLQQSILNLNMVKRRQEVRGKYKGSLIIDDFAHHPKAIVETIKAIKTKYSNKKLAVIFEPVSATARSNAFQSDFAQSFKSADRVVIADPNMKTTAKSYDQLDTSKLVEDIRGLNIDAECVDSLDSLIAKIDSMAGDQTVIAIFSNRTCLNLWSSDFINELK